MATVRTSRSDAKKPKADPKPKKKRLPQVDPDPTRGENVILSYGLPVEVEQLDGTTEIYYLRRLAISDIFTLIPLIEPVFAHGMGATVASMGQEAWTPRGLQTALLLGMKHGQKGTVDFLANILDVPIESLSDPFQFPLPSIIKLVKALNDHPDLKTFFVEAHIFAELVAGLWDKMISTIYPEFRKTQTPSSESLT